MSDFLCRCGRTIKTRHFAFTFCTSLTFCFHIQEPVRLLQLFSIVHAAITFAGFTFAAHCQFALKTVNVYLFCTESVPANRQHFLHNTE